MKKNAFHYIVFYLFKYLPHQNFSRDFELQILLKISFFLYKNFEITTWFQTCCFFCQIDCTNNTLQGCRSINLKRSIYRPLTIKKTLNNDRSIDRSFINKKELCYSF